MAKAIKTTFVRRKTVLAEIVPLALTSEFSCDPGKQIQWRAFLKRNQSHVSKNLYIPDVIGEIREFLVSPLQAAARGESFDFLWSPGGPWRRVESRPDIL